MEHLSHSFVAALTFATFIDKIVTILQGLVSLAIALSILLFFWGALRFLWFRKNGDSKGIKEAGNMLAWALIALFVMVSIWGIIALFQETLGFIPEGSNPGPSNQNQLI